MSKSGQLIELALLGEARAMLILDDHHLWVIPLDQELIVRRRSKKNPNKVGSDSTPHSEHIRLEQLPRLCLLPLG